MSPFTRRTIFYSMTLCLAFCNQGFALALGIMDDFSPHQRTFSIMLAAFCIATWIWSSVLLSYNNRPTSTHALTKAIIHFYSFLPLVPIYFALGVMMLSQVHYNCNTTRYSDGEATWWCESGIISGSFSLLQCLFAALAVWSIRRSVAFSLTGLRTNVAVGDKRKVTGLPLENQA